MKSKSLAGYRRLSPAICYAAAAIALCLIAAGCASRTPELPPPLPPVIVAPAPPPAPAATETRIVMASWYGEEESGNQTASGETFNPDGLTAAARDFPLGTRVTVTNLGNGRSVEVRINDCGPHQKGRRLDLSRAAARRIGMTGHGVTSVRVTVVGPPVSEHRCTPRKS
ncbi:MAG TPA: septal ring lytic transglycosylase RlpA family protein [Candidatus Binataceae bacterium]